MSVPNTHLRISTLRLSSVDKKYSLGVICLLRKSSLSKSNDSYARRIYSCPSAGRGTQVAKGSSGHQRCVMPCKQQRCFTTPLLASRDPHLGSAQRSAFNRKAAAFPPVSTFTKHRAQRILTAETKNVHFLYKLSGYSDYMHHLFMYISLLAVLHQAQCLPGWDAVASLLQRDASLTIWALIFPACPEDLA